MATGISPEMMVSLVSAARLSGSDVMPLAGNDTSESVYEPSSGPVTLQADVLSEQVPLHKTSPHNAPVLVSKVAREDAHSSVSRRHQNRVLGV